MALMDDRKKRIMEHLARSTGDFVIRSSSASAAAKSERKRQILDHVRRTTG